MQLFTFLVVILLPVCFCRYRIDSGGISKGGNMDSANECFKLGGLFVNTLEIAITQGNEGDFVERVLDLTTEDFSFITDNYTPPKADSRYSQFDFLKYYYDFWKPFAVTNYLAIYGSNVSVKIIYFLSLCFQTFKQKNPLFVCVNTGDWAKI